jgi:hypothetical protein
MKYIKTFESFNYQETNEEWNPFAAGAGLFGGLVLVTHLLVAGIPKDEFKGDLKVQKIELLDNNTYEVTSTNKEGKTIVFDTNKKLDFSVGDSVKVNLSTEGDVNFDKK